LVKSGSAFERFENLRNAKACFPEFGGIGKTLLAFWLQNNRFFSSLQIYTNTASIAFINIGKNRGIFKKSECDYTQLLADFFGDSCAPGSRDQLHDPSGTTPQSLCNLCREAIVPFAAPIHDEEEETDVQYDEATGDDDVGVDEDDKPAASVPNVQVEITRNVNCAANPTNQFYGTRGALSCLQQ
jgi:hypothetical protein